MVTSLYGAVEQGLIYAIMALGVYLTFRILDFPDLTVDGSFVTGGAVSAVMIVNGYDPFVSILAGGLIGFFAGCVTGILHTHGKINPLLSGIIMMIALYSINLRIMGKPTIPLLNETTWFKQIGTWWEQSGIDAAIFSLFSSMSMEEYMPKTFLVIFSMMLLVMIIKKMMDWLLATEAGLALRATGDNDRMAKSFSANTKGYIIIGLGISNGMVAVSGAMITHYNGFADINLGIGMIIVGLASVIIGEGLFGKDKMARATLAVILGAIIYRIIISLALRMDFLDASDMKLITAVIVVGALVIPVWWRQFRDRKKRMARKKEIDAQEQTHTEGASQIATTEAD